MTQRGKSKNVEQGWGLNKHKGTEVLTYVDHDGHSFSKLSIHIRLLLLSLRPLYYIFRPSTLKRRHIQCP